MGPAPTAHLVRHSLRARWTWAAADSRSPATSQPTAQVQPAAHASRPDRAAAPSVTSASASEAARHINNGFTDKEEFSSPPEVSLGWDGDGPADGMYVEQLPTASEGSFDTAEGYSRAQAATSSSDPAGFADAQQQLPAPQASRGHEPWHSTAREATSKAESALFVAGEETLREPLCLTESNYQHVADTIAGDERVIVLTTLDLSYRGKDHSDEQLLHMKNFAYHLDVVNRLQNTMTVSYTEDTCRLLLSVSIPCFVDHISPQPEKLPGRLQQETAHFSKYWHALSLLKLGITVYFSDSDAAILQDPFVFQDR